MRKLLLLVLFLSACALPPAVDASRLQYLAPPAFAAAYDLAPGGAGYADDRGFLLVVQPRGSSAVVEIAGGAAAEAFTAAAQAPIDDDSREEMMVRGVTAVRIDADNRMSIAWREGGNPYYVTVTTGDEQTIQIFVNALASYQLTDWRTNVGLP